MKFTTTAVLKMADGLLLPQNESGFSDVTKVMGYKGGSDTLMARAQM